ncbi:MAG: phosphodiester glycosidase family protein [Clostridia bacterium]|nr:phosphodiester glycosidase family protein [Clostridia bacterium]
MSTRSFKKCLALFLSLLLILTSLSVLAAAASTYTPTGDFYKISETQYKIAPGVTENRYILNKSSGMQQETVYAVTVDNGASTASFMAGYADYNGNRWKMQKVRDQAVAAQNATGRNVVAAFNADIFNMQTGEPTGTLIMGGSVYKEGLDRPYFGVTKSGEYVIGESMKEADLSNLREAVGGFYMLVKNGRRTGPGKDPESNIAPKTAVGLKEDGSVVVVCVDGRNYPISSNLSDYDLATIMLDVGCVKAVNLDGGGSTTYLAKYEGKSALELANRPSDAVERAVGSSLFIVSTAAPSGVFDHASLTPNNTLYTPGAVVAFSAIGVDSAGESADLPADGAFRLAPDSAALGSITADGVFTSNGSVGVVNVQYVSGGAAVGSTSIEITTPDELYIPGEEYSLDFDESTDFELMAKNAGRTVNIKAGDLVWGKALADPQTLTYGDEPLLYSGGVFTYYNRDETFDGGETTTESFSTSVARSVKEVLSEFLTGDGETTTFTLASRPYSLKAVYVNGTKLGSSKYSYTRSTGELVFNTAPAADASCEIQYNLYSYNCTLAGCPKADDITKVTCSSEITDYTYDEATGALYYESVWSASTKVKYYGKTYTLADPAEVIVVSVDGAVIDTGYTYDASTGVLAFDDAHPGSMITVKKAMTPDEGEALKTQLIGSFSGNTFTAAPAVSCTGIVTAASAYDPAIAISVNVVIGAEPVMLYDFEYTTDRQEAEESGGRLQWIPSYQLPTFDRLNEMGENPDNKSHTEFAAEWNAEGYPLYSWPNASLGYTGMKSTIVSAADGEPVRFGDHSIRIDVDFSSYNLTSNSNNYLRVTSPSYFFPGSPKKIGAWVYVPEGLPNFCLYLNCSQKDETYSYAPVSEQNADGSTNQNWVGWKYVEMDLYDNTKPNIVNIGANHAPFGLYQGCGIFWVSFQPGKGFGEKAAGTVYVDNIQLIYGSNTDDTKNPVVSSIRYDTNDAPEEIVNNQTVLTDNTVTIRASYNDQEDKYMSGINSDTVRMSIDGVDVTDKCFINEGDEEIYLYNANLKNGLHSVNITLYDNFGNKTTETRYFRVDGTQKAAAEIVAEQESPVLGSDYSLAVKAADNVTVESAEIAVHTFALFTSYYRNVRVEPAEGYRLTEEPVYDRTNAIIRFKVERDGGALAGDGTVARIVYAIPSDVPADSIGVTFRVDTGKLVYTTTGGETENGSFSGRIDTSCIAPLLLTSDVFLVGSAGGYFYVTDLSGAPVAGARVLLSDGTAVTDAVSDENGKLFTDAFVNEIQAVSVFAEKDGLISFIYTTQSYDSGGEEDGKPGSIVLNGAKDGATMINISWFASPLTSANAAVARIAKKADYDAIGDAALNDVAGASRLEELASAGSLAANKALLFNRVEIVDLTPDTEYVYCVGDGANMSELRTFRTGKKQVDTRFFIIGDMQDPDTTNLEAILDALENAEDNYEFGIQTGDAVDNGGMYKWWVNVASIFSSGYLSTRPIIHVLGNHEYYGDFSGENAADYFGMQSENGAAPLAYSSTYGNVYVAVINYADNAEKYEQAIEWVKNDVTTTTATWKVLALHQPAYYTNPGGGSQALTQMIPALVDEYGFSFVFSGHDHSYVRTYPVTAGVRDDNNGAVYYICGSTGEKSYAVVENPDFPFEFVRGSAATEGEYNAIYMTAATSDTTFTVDTHEVTVMGDGTYTDEIIDSYTMTKAITCSEAGDHVYGYKDGSLVCSVCGYVKPVGDYTGFAEDLDTGRTRYFIGGTSKTGWQTYGTDCYYFDENGVSVTAGTRTIDGITYTFDDEGKQVGGAFVKTEDGYTRCYRGGDYLTGWNEIDGKTYFFSTSSSHPGKMLTGKTRIIIFTGQEITYTFASDGHLTDYVWVEESGGKRYYWAQNPVTGWMTIDGKQYYFDPATALMQTGEVEIDGKIYAFNSNGALLHEGAHDYVFTHYRKVSCTETEANVYKCSICGRVREKILQQPLGHADADDNDLCDNCGKAYKVKPAFFEPIARLFYIIRNWFRSLGNK